MSKTSKSSKTENEMVELKETPVKMPLPKLKTKLAREWAARYGDGIYRFARDIIGEATFRSRTWTEDLRARGGMRESLADHRSDIAAHAILSALIRETLGQQIDWKKLAIMIGVHDLLYEAKFGTDFTPPIKRKMTEVGITKNLLDKFFLRVANSSCSGLPIFLTKTLLGLARESEEMRSIEAQILREADCIAEMVQIDEWKESGLSSSFLETLNKMITRTEAGGLKSSPYILAFLSGRQRE